MKFKYTLLVVLLVFSLLPLYALGVVMVYENDKITEDVVSESLENISNTHISDIKSFCEERKEYMELIRQYDDVQNEVLYSLGRKEWNSDEAHLRLENMLKEHKRTNSFIQTLSVVDADYRVVASSGEYTRGEIAKLDKITSLSGEFGISHVYKREIKTTMCRLVAAYDGIYHGGELIGYIIEEISTSYFNQYRDSMARTDNGTIRIIDEDGQIITAGMASEGQNTATYKMTDEEQEKYNKKWNAIDWKKNSTGSITYTVQGDKHITYYSDLDYTGWKICIDEDLSAYHNRTERFGRMIFLILAVLTVALLAVQMYLSGRLTKPLRRIVDTLTRVRQEHDYSLRVNSKSRDEFGVLSNEIDELLFYAEVAQCREQRKQKHLERKAEKDPLTGIYNKTAIGQYIEQKIETEAKYGGEIAVGFVDIDNFKEYNTRYGHQAGDEVICFVADTLREYMGAGVGRNGGDEFLFCLSEQTGREELDKRVDALLKKLNEGFHNDKTGENMSVPCSIGVTVAKADESTHESLIEDADEAMYQTKRNGKNSYTIIG